MKVKTIRYAMLRVTGQYENDRAEVEIELEDGDPPAVVIERAKRLCREALGKEQAAADRRRSDAEERFEKLELD